MDRAALRDDAVFSSIVSLDVRGQATPEAQRVLRKQENLARWRLALIEILQTLKIQYAAADEASRDDALDQERGRIDRLTYLDRQAERATWLRRAKTVERGCLVRMTEVKELIKVANIIRGESENQVKRYLYREAIKTHREATSEPTPADLQLWAVLDDSVGG